MVEELDVPEGVRRGKGGRPAAGNLHVVASVESVEVPSAELIGGERVSERSAGIGRVDRGLSGGAREVDGHGAVLIGLDEAARDRGLAYCRSANDGLAALSAGALGALHGESGESEQDKQ